MLLLQMAVRLGTPIIVSPLLVRIDGSDALGVYSVMLEILGWVLLLDLGIGTAITREIAQGASSGRPDEELALLGGTAFRFLATVGFVASLATLGIAFTLDRWLKGPAPTLHDARTALVIFGCWIVLRFPAAFFHILLYARQNITRYALADTLGETARAILSIVAVSTGWGLPGLALAAVISQAGTFLLCAWWTRRDPLARAWRTGASAPLLKRLLLVSYPMAVMSLADRMSLFSQNTIVGYLFNTRVSASFYATRTPGFYAGSIIWRLADATFPGINDLFGAKLFDALRSAYVRLVGYAVGAALWLAAGILCFNRELVTLWLGASFDLGHAASLAVAALILVATFKNITAKFAFVEDSIQRLMVVMLIEALAAVALSFVFGWLWGATGVLWAPAAAATISVVYLAWRTASIVRFRGVMAGMAEVLRVALPAAAVGVAGCLLWTTVRNASPALWPAALAVVAVTGGLGFFLFGMVRSDRDALLQLLFAWRRRRAADRA